jgi:putative ABC transport system substrate-binding protein
LAAKAATQTLPVVFIVGDDPVRVGLTRSLNRPETNATGVSLVTSSLGAKRLALLFEAMPKLTVAALLINPTNSNAEAHTSEVRTAADEVRCRLAVYQSSSSEMLDGIFQDLKREGISALLVQNDPFFDTQRTAFAVLAAQHGIAAIYHIREFPLAGGLMSYGPDLADGYYQLGLQTGRVLNGSDPKYTPVTRPNKFQLVINTRTARALGLSLSPSLLARADEVIE